MVNLRMCWSRRLACLALAVTLAFSFIARAEDRSPDVAIARPRDRSHNGMVVTQEARAARVGIDILRKGGNAVDAAVAVGVALAVSYPRAGNIGGGGLW